MKVMTVSLSPNPSPARGEGRFVSRVRDFHSNQSVGQSIGRNGGVVETQPEVPGFWC